MPHRYLRVPTFGWLTSGRRQRQRGEVTYQEAALRQRRLMADRRLPTFGTARSKPAGQDMGLNVSKVASNSSTGAPGLGHNRSYREPKDCVATDRCTRYCGRRPSSVRGVQIPKAAARCLSMPKACRPSAAPHVEWAQRPQGEVHSHKERSFVAEREHFRKNEESWPSMPPSRALATRGAVV